MAVVPLTDAEKTQVCIYLGYSPYFVSFENPSRYPVIYALEAISDNEAAIDALRLYMQEIVDLEEKLEELDDLYIAGQVESGEIQPTTIKATVMFKSKIRTRIGRISNLLATKPNPKAEPYI